MKRGFLLYKLCPFMYAFSLFLFFPCLTISLQSLEATKAFSVCFSAALTHEPTTVQFCWRPLGLFGFSEQDTVMNYCVLLLKYHIRGIPVPVFTLQGTNGTIERTASSEWAHSVHNTQQSPPFTQHTHHFKKITLLMASQNSRPLLTHTHGWCVFNILNVTFLTFLRSHWTSINIVLV